MMWVPHLLDLWVLNWGFSIFFSLMNEVRSSTKSKMKVNTVCGRSHIPKELRCSSFIKDERCIFHDRIIILYHFQFFLRFLKKLNFQRRIWANQVLVKGLRMKNQKEFFKGFSNPSNFQRILMKLNPRMRIQANQVLVKWLQMTKWLQK